MSKESQGSPHPTPGEGTLTERLAGALSELSDDEYYVLRSRALARRPTSYPRLAEELGITRGAVVDAEHRAVEGITRASAGPDRDALTDAMSQENSTVALATLLPQHPVLTETVPRTNLPVWAFLVQTLDLENTRAGQAATPRKKGSSTRIAATRDAKLPSRRPGPPTRVTRKNVRPAWTAWFPWLITLKLAGHGTKTTSWDFEPQARGRLRHQVLALTTLITEELPAAPVGIIFPAIAPDDAMSDIDIPASHAARFREQGIETFADLAERTVAELRFLPHYGAKTLNTLVQRMIYRSLQHPAPAGAPVPPSAEELERPLHERLSSTLGYLDERSRAILVGRRFAEPQIPLPKLAEQFHVSTMHAQQIDSRSASLMRTTLMSPALRTAIDTCLPAPDGTMPVADLVTRYPDLGEIVAPAENQPAWRVLEGLGGFFEVAGGHARRSVSIRKRSSSTPRQTGQD